MILEDIKYFKWLCSQFYEIESHYGKVWLDAGFYNKMYAWANSEYNVLIEKGILYFKSEDEKNLFLTVYELSQK